MAAIDLAAGMFKPVCSLFFHGEFLEATVFAEQARSMPIQDLVWRDARVASHCFLASVVSRDWFGESLAGFLSCESGSRLPM